MISTQLENNYSRQSENWIIFRGIRVSMFSNKKPSPTETTWIWRPPLVTWITRHSASRVARWIITVHWWVTKRQQLRVNVYPVSGCKPKWKKNKHDHSAKTTHHTNEIFSKSINHDCTQQTFHKKKLNSTGKKNNKTRWWNLQGIWVIFAIWGRFPCWLP